MKQSFFYILVSLIAFMSFACSDSAKKKAAADAVRFTSIDGHVSTGPNEKEAYDKLLVTQKEVELNEKLNNGEITEYQIDTMLLHYKSEINIYNIKQETKAKLIMTE